MDDAAGVQAVVAAVRPSVVLLDVGGHGHDDLDPGCGEQLGHALTELPA